MSDRLPAFEKLTPEMQKALSDVTGAVNTLKVSSVYPCRS